jgi:hypothetical protein
MWQPARARPESGVCMGACLCGAPCTCRWTCWNTLFLLYWVEAHSNNPATGRWSECGCSHCQLPTWRRHPLLRQLLQPRSCCRQGQNIRPLTLPPLPPAFAAIPSAGPNEIDLPAVIDAPLWWHWRKAGVWVILEGVMVAMAVLIRDSVAAHNKPPPDAPTQDCRLWPYSCRGTSACAAQLQMLLA